MNLHKFRAELSDLINHYSYNEHVIGQNDCNIMFAEYLDLILGTDYKNKLVGNYTTIPEGLRKTKKLTGFVNVLDACQKHLIQSEEIKDGSVILSKRKTNNKEFYSTSIVFDNQVLIEENNKYVPRYVTDVEYELIFNRT